MADFFVSHQLAVNDLYIALKYRPIPVPGATFVGGMNFLESMEPGIELIPDGYAEVRTPDRVVAASS